MKIVSLAPGVSRTMGGIYEVERNLAQALVRSSPVTVDVVGMEDEHSADDLPGWEPLEPNVLSVKGPSAFKYAPDLLPTLRKLNPDLVHQHALWLYPSVATLRWTRKTGQPHVVSIHGMLDEWALNHAHWKKRIAAWLYEDANLQEAVCLHVHTEDEHRAVREYGIETPVCLIPNGVTLPPEDIRSEAPWSSHIQSDRRVLLFLGRVHPKKGIFELVEAWKRLRERAPDVADAWTVAFVGWDDGGYTDQLQARIVEADLDDDLYFLGPMFGDEKHAAFSHADAFVLPSHSEGLPIAVLEAWSHRLPVLLTPGCNLAIGVEKGAAAETKPSPDRLSRDLRAFLQRSDQELDQMGANGRHLVEERYSWTQVARQMHRVYRWILNGGERPSTVHFD